MNQNEILIRTNSGEYVGGDTIYGTVYLTLKEAIPSRTLKLIIRGYEKCEYEYSYVVSVGNEEYESRTSKRSAKQPFLTEDIKMIEYPGGFPRGCFSFPFQYQLPHGIPGVFLAQNEEEHEVSYEGTIKYTIGAALGNPSMRPKLQVETSILVYDSLDCRNSHIVPDKEERSGVVKTFFCLNRGRITASTELNKGSYSSDEVINLKVVIKNESSVDVLGATITVIRVLKLLGKDHERQEEELVDYTTLKTILTRIHDGCTKGNNITWEESMHLQERQNGVALPPSTSGSIVKCSYFIDLEIHCPWAPDIEVNQPLNIKPPLNIIWKQWEPPEWIRNCTLGPVTLPLAVPRDILQSRSFSAVPGFAINYS